MKKGTVVARLTMLKKDGSKLIVDVKEDASFHEFYRWHRQVGRKRKVFLRTSSRNDGITPYWRAGFDMPGLDVVAARTTSFMKDVTSATVKVLRKRKYQALLTCPPNELAGGLPKYESKPIVKVRLPDRLPVGYLTLQKRMDILTGVKR